MVYQSFDFEGTWWRLFHKRMHCIIYLRFYYRRYRRYHFEFLRNFVCNNLRKCVLISKFYLSRIYKIKRNTFVVQERICACSNQSLCNAVVSTERIFYFPESDILQWDCTFQINLDNTVIDLPILIFHYM